MEDNFSTSNLDYIISRYKAKYNGRVLWETILNNIKTFKLNEEAILNNPKLCMEWQGFLRYLIEIEESIGLYGYTRKGHLHRVFVMFGRAYLEEKEVITVTEDTDKALTWIFPDSQYFKSGDGQKGDIDLHDRNNITYDVKNDSINFDKAHEADFLLKYRSWDGGIELHQRPKFEGSGSFIELFASGRPLAELAASYDLDPLLFDKNSTEDMIKNYLGYKEI